MGRVGILLVALACVVESCGGGAGEVSAELRALERLSFVPASRSVLFDWRPGQAPFADVSLERALLMDRYEVTRRDCVEYGVGAVAEHAGTALPGFVSDAARLTPETLDWPAFLTFAEAEAIAVARDMRLPTPAEWLHVATGGGGLHYPYHAYTEQKGFANTADLGLGTPAPVGSFENGRSQRFGCYDVHGNVWEWVDGVVPGHDDPTGLAAAASAPGDRIDDGLASVMGGSYQSASERTFTSIGSGEQIRFFSRLLDKRELHLDVGVRLVADAERYLFEHAEAWGSNEVSLERLRAVGAGWSESVGRSRVVRFLERLLERPDPPAGLRVLLDGARGDEG